MGQTVSKENLEKIVRRLKDPVYAKTPCDCVDVPCVWRDRNVSIDKSLLKFKWTTEKRYGMIYSSSETTVLIDPSKNKCMLALLNVNEN